MGLAVFFAGVAIPLHVTFAQGSCTNPIDTNESDCISNGAQWIPAGGGGAGGGGGGGVTVTQSTGSCSTLKANPKLQDLI